MIGRSLLIASALLLAACSGRDEPDVVALPLAEVQQRLLEVEVPSDMFGSNPVEIEPEASGTQVRWIVRRKDEEVMRFLADLTPESAGTQMKLDLQGTKEGPFGNVERRLEKKPEIKRLYLANMREAISSDFEGRPFDRRRTYKELSSAIVANMPDINATFDRAAEQYERESRRAFHDAYARQ
ncbi:hypothetical protein GCM10022280_08470 [Sphingomonas swuensis]|uniref:Lipoprotein n=1 Tax=Sphingomonas swuensis TaxID=977800 RepID=A0ABP7SK67_9SPHN